MLNSQTVTCQQNQNNRLLSIITRMSGQTSLFCVHKLSDFSRNRVFTFENTIKFILGMAGNSLNKELYDFFKDKDYSATASAFVQQRAKIKPYAFEHLFKEFDKACSDSKTYKGYHLYAVDGSALNIPRNPNDSDTYLSQGCNQLHLNALYDLENHTYLDCMIQGRAKMNEVHACTEMVKRNRFHKAILIADRGYGSLNLIETVNRTEGLNYLIRVKNDWLTETRDMLLKELDTQISFELRTTQSREDQLLYREGKAKWISGKSKRGKVKKQTTWFYESPCNMTLRVVRFEISEGNYETIVTSLNRIEFPLQEIKKLYHRRWGIETSFRELKYAIGLVNIHAKKREFIEQEIWAKLTMYNYAERIIAQVVVHQDKSRKWQYQVNFTMGFHICIDMFRTVMCHNVSPPDVGNLISRYILPIRPDRKDERKLRPKGVVGFIYRVA
jgi:hypothetical protein